MFLKNGNISSKIKRSKVTDYAALTFLFTLVCRSILYNRHRVAGIQTHFINTHCTLKTNFKMIFVCLFYSAFTVTGSVQHMKPVHTCTDPESFVRVGPNLIIVLVYEGIEGPNTAINVPSLARQRNAIQMAFRWKADGGPILNAGLVAL